jgi:predicted MFS family arabinose efflux permease
MSDEVPVSKTADATISSRGRSVGLISASTFFYWTALYIYVPVLSVYAQSKGASLSMVGLIVAVYAFPQLALRIPLGIWSDSLGRQKPLVIAGIGMVTLGAITLIVAPNPLFLAISRVLTGIGAAAWGMYTIYLVSFYPANRSGQVIAILNLICSGALVVATLAGGAISNVWGERYAFIAAAVLGLISFIVVLFAKENRIQVTDHRSWRGFTQVAKKPLLLVVSLMGVLLFYAQFSGTLGFVPIYAAKIGASDTELGILTMLTMGVSMVGALLVAPMVRRYGHVFTIVSAALMLGLALLLVPFVSNVFILEGLQSLNGLGQGILTVELMALSIYGVAPNQRATSMGFYQAVYAVGMLVGPMTSGFLADRFGLGLVFYLSAGLCAVVAGLAFLPVLPRKD